jgi:hypothetical protein
MDDDDVMADMQEVQADGFAVEVIAGGTELRRQVFAGDVIPDSWKIEPAPKATKKKADEKATSKT